MEYQVQHPQWKIWTASETTLGGEMTAFYGSEFASVLGAQPTSAFVADGSPVKVFQGSRIN